MCCAQWVVLCANWPIELSGLYCFFWNGRYNGTDWLYGYKWADFMALANNSVRAELNICGVWFSFSVDRTFDNFNLVTKSGSAAGMPGAAEVGLEAWEEESSGRKKWACRTVAFQKTVEKKRTLYSLRVKENEHIVEQNNVALISALHVQGWKRSLISIKWDDVVDGSRTGLKVKCGCLVEAGTDTEKVIGTATKIRSKQRSRFRSGHVLKNGRLFAHSACSAPTCTSTSRMWYHRSQRTPQLNRPV